MLRHIVLCNFQDVSVNERKTLLNDFLKLKNKIPGIVAISGGIPLAQDEFTKGFNFVVCIDVEDEQVLEQQYFPHPDHKKIEKFIMDHLVGGMNGIVAVDFRI